MNNTPAEKIETARNRVTAAEKERAEAFQVWKEAREARFKIKPLPLCCPVETKALEALHLADKKLARVSGQFARRYPTA